jgi:hypothetical protein
MPWPYSFIIRKRQQIDSFNELPKEKRPPEKMIWWGTPENIEEWMEKVYPTSGKKEELDGINMIIEDNEIE